MRSLLVCSLMLSLAGAAGCVADGAPEDSDELFLVADGKADNYYSNVAAEFEVSGTIPVEMTAEEFADEQVRADKVSRRLTAVGLYLTAYVTDKFRGIDSNGDGMISESEVFFRNEGYGGFHAMVRNYSTETVEVASGESGYQVSFTIDLAGPKDLATLIPRAMEGGNTFDFQMPKGATIDPMNVPRRDIRSFDPSTYMGELETVHASIRAHEAIANAYPQFASFVADGLFDITLFFGHDYNTPRSDLQEAREAFDVLKELGFTAPVESYEQLAAASGPFTRQMKANGIDVRVEVRIFHSDMFLESRREQHDLALSEIVARDVFFYNGHAGPYFGFYLDAAYAATVNYGEFASAPWSADRQQLVVAQGCQTYSQYADMLYAAEAKDESNLDVITTVNYSYGAGTMQLLRSLLKTDRYGRHVPVDFYRIVSEMNSDWINSYRDVFYGVMGLDGNPQIHPYANPAMIGEQCSSASDCGDPIGNACLQDASRVRRCASLALAPAGCPEGTRYRPIARRATIEGGACIAN